jgi:hypothetical protein
MNRMSVPSSRASFSASKASPEASDPVGRDMVWRDALAPNGQLLDGRGAERIAGGEHHLEAFARRDRGELADGGGFTRAVDADDENDEGLLGAEIERHLDGFEHLGDFRGQNAFDLLGIDLLVVAPGGNCLDDALGYGEAEIGLDQHVFQFIERRLIELALGEDRRDRPGDRFRRFRQSVLELRQPARRAAPARVRAAQ